MSIAVFRKLEPEFEKRSSAHAVAQEADVRVKRVSVQLAGYETA